MAKTYNELEAWGIFFGALIIGIVLTSVFWAYITIPEEEKKIEIQLQNASKENKSDFQLIRPAEFERFCAKIDGTANWDNSGFRQCIKEDYTQKDLIAMSLLCKTYNLTMSYGSYGVKCEGKV